MSRLSLSIVVFGLFAVPQVLAISCMTGLDVYADYEFGRDEVKSQECPNANDACECINTVLHIFGVGNSSENIGGGEVKLIFLVLGCTSQTEAMLRNEPDLQPYLEHLAPLFNEPDNGKYDECNGFNFSIPWEGSDYFAAVDIGFEVCRCNHTDDCNDNCQLDFTRPPNPLATATPAEDALYCITFVQVEGEISYNESRQTNHLEACVSPTAQCWCAQHTNGIVAHVEEVVAYNMTSHVITQGCSDNPAVSEYLFPLDIEILNGLNNDCFSNRTIVGGGTIQIYREVQFCSCNTPACNAACLA